MKLANIVQEAPDDVYYLGLVNGKKITSDWKVTSDLTWAKNQAKQYSKKHSGDDISVIEILPGAKIGGGNNKVVYKIKGRVTESVEGDRMYEERLDAIYTGVLKAIRLGQQNPGQVKADDVTAIVEEIEDGIAHVGDDFSE